MDAKPHSVPFDVREFIAFAENLDTDIGPMFGRDASQLAHAYISLEEQVEALTGRNQFLSTEQVRADIAEARVRELEEQYEVERHAWKCLDEEREAEIARLKEQLETAQAETRTEWQRAEGLRFDLAALKEQFEIALKALKDIAAWDSSQPITIEDGRRRWQLAIYALSELDRVSNPAKKPYVYSGDVDDPGPFRDGDPIEGRPGWSWSKAEGRPVWNQESSQP